MDFVLGDPATFLRGLAGCCAAGAVVVEAATAASPGDSEAAASVLLRPALEACAEVALHFGGGRGGGAVDVRRVAETAARVSLQLTEEEGEKRLPDPTRIEFERHVQVGKSPSLGISFFFSHAPLKVRRSTRRGASGRLRLL